MVVGRSVFPRTMSFLDLVDLALFISGSLRHCQFDRGLTSLASSEDVALGPSDSTQFLQKQMTLILLLTWSDVPMVDVDTFLAD